MRNITTIFYAPHENFFKGNVQLPKDESHHMIRVLRFSIDDKFVVTDGEGRVYMARLIKADPKRALGEILPDEELPHISNELRFRVAAAVGIIRPKRYEKMISSLAQLGIDEIIPMICKYSEPSYIGGISGEHFQKRLETIARNSAKGALRINFPTLYEPVEFLTVLEDWTDRRKYFGDPEGLPVVPKIKGREELDILILIGPEGGFSHREIETMRDMNVIPIGLGRTRLRTETAAVAMLVKVLNGLGML